MSSAIPTGPESERQALVAQRTLTQQALASARRRLREARDAGRPYVHLYAEADRCADEAAEVEVRLVLGSAAWEQLLRRLLVAQTTTDAPEDDTLVDTFVDDLVEQLSAKVAGVVWATLRNDMPSLTEWAADRQAEADEAAAERKWEDRRLWAPEER